MKTKQFENAISNTLKDLVKKDKEQPSRMYYCEKCKESHWIIQGCKKK